MRFRGFLRKETLQIRRDPSSILLAIVLPLALLFLFGYGVSLDAKDVPVALVIDRPGQTADDLAARFELSPYFLPTRVSTMHDAEELLREGKVDGIVRVRAEFTRDSELHEDAPVQLILNAVDANRSRLVLGYVRGIIGTNQEIKLARDDSPPHTGVVLESRIRFNESANSTYFLIPGLLTLVTTLIGVLLTALVIAREWERGTMEAILATPLRPSELMLGKVLPYFVLGMLGMLMSVTLGVVLFGVPFRGSVPVLLVSGCAFLFASLGLGLFISSAMRVQFIAAQISIVTGFLPALFLSGLLFDLDSTPRAIQIISYIVPARYFVSISHTLFLAGDIYSIIIPNTLVLSLMALLLLTLARSKLGLRLERRSG